MKRFTPLHCSKGGSPLPLWLRRNNVSRLLSAAAFALFLASALIAHSQSLTVSTLAGYAGPGSADGTGTSARFANPWGVATDSAGNVYIADTDNHAIRKITTGGVVSTLAGLAGVSGSANGTGAGARFYQPQGVAVDGAGNVYVADTGNYTIRKITPAGVVTTLAGSAGISGSTDGSSALFYEPEGVAVNSAGTFIYVADTWNHTIRQVTSAGVVSTLAGSAGNYGSANGTGSGASFDQPQGLAVDGAGNLYVGDTGNQMIRQITSAGVVTTLAGSTNYGSANGTGASASFWNPQGIALDTATNLYLADSFNNTIRKITPSGVVSTLAGMAGSFGSADGTGAAARFWQPQGVAVDINGNVYVADSANGTIREIGSGAVVTTLAGSASTGSADGTGSSARFYWPSGAAVDSSGNSYVADTENGTIRTITSAGVVSTLAGSAGNFGSTDATGSNARFYGPQSVAVGSSGTLYVADTANHTIRRITSGGVVTTLAGLAGTNGPTDGTGSNARFNAPQGLAVDTSGNVFVADTWNHTIRKVTSSGVVTTLAGLPGYYGDIDGTSAGTGTNTARFYCPSGVAVDASGNVYVADTRNHTIRMVTSAGVVSTLAGLAGSYGSADGANSSARFYLPQSITVDASGNLYVLDSGNQTVRKVAPVGANWVVTTIAGQADVSGSADGTGSSAQFFYPDGLGMNAAGSFCVADWGNNTIRAGVSSLNAAPVIVVEPQNQTANQGQSAAFSVTATGSAPLSYQWQFNSSPLSGATSSTYTVANAQPANVGSYSVIVTNTLGAATSSPPALLTVIVPPAITNLPQSLTVTQGLNATFTVGASGTVPFTYQWTFDSGNISGATASSYTVANAQPANAGSYAVVVSNPAGSATSSPPAILTVNAVPTPPGVTSQPQNQTVSQTSNATFAVTATGTTPLSYQWRFNGASLASATASSYTCANAQSTNAGSYSVIVTNSYGSITSSTATLTVILPPIISVQPSNQLAAVSNNVTFTVGLSQGTSPAYQWQQNGTAISGATLSSLTLTSISWSSAGTYSVVVSNSAGNPTSAGATLIVEQAAFTFFDGFESYNKGSLDNTTTGGPNPTSPWWGLNTTAQGWVTNANGGVTPHGGSQMAGAAGTSKQDYINLLYRMNAGQIYYGNFMCDWWFYDPYGTGTGATSSQDYLAITQYNPVSTTSDTSTFTAYNQRMSLGTYNGATGYNYLNYQARIIGGTGTFGSGNSWYNTTTVRSVGWHHARIIVGIPNASNYAPVGMYIDNMLNATVTSSGTNLGYNLIEVNHYSTAAANGWYYDDLTFRAANDPWIVEQPVSQAVNVGQPASFNTVAVGTAYQWQFNGTNINAATTSAYSLASVAANNAGSYACVITGTNGTLATSPATLTVTGIPPSITAQPQSLTVTQGQDAAFSVTAAGTAPLSYQWLFNDAPISSANASGYTLTSAQSTNAGSYSVVVSNSAGSVTSSNALLTVLVPPTIAAQPQSLTVTQGQSAAFSVTPAGTAPFVYQWLFNGGAISTATASGYTLTSAQSTNAGSYSVAVSNSAGSVTSSNALLTVLLPPSIAAQPQSLTVTQGQSAAFSVTPAGTAPFAYQWLFNGGAISAATASGYTLTSAQSTNAGSYSVAVSNSAGSVTSSNALLTVLVPPTIAAQPQSLTVTQGQTAAFSVTPAGTTPLSCQWLFNSAPISGATDTNYTVTSAQQTDAGSYSVVVTNVLGSVTSSVAPLTVIVPPVITNQPISQTIPQGTCATFTVAASGTTPLTYQWQWNNTIYPPDTNSNSTSFTAYNAGSYSVTISNQAGLVVSDTVTLSFTNPPPALGGHFDSLSLLADGSLQLNMSGIANTDYVLEFTSDWVSWAPIVTNLSDAGGLFQFNDTSAITNSERFYRLRLAP
jgi:sugar lactone lactonase YvrE